VWGSAPNDVWVGGPGLLLHWNGTAWADTGVLTAGTSVSALWGSAADDVWGVSGAYDMASGGYVGVTLHYDGGTWSSTPTNIPGAFAAVWGTGARDVWAVSGSGASAHFDGSAWTHEPTGAALGLSGVWATSHEVWAVGEDGAILRRQR